MGAFFRIKLRLAVLLASPETPRRKSDGEPVLPGCFFRRERTVPAARSSVHLVCGNRSNRCALVASDASGR